MRTRKKNRKVIQAALAIVIAVVLWLYVINVENPTGTARLRELPVQLQGEEVLEENGLMVTDLSRDTVTIRLNGRKNTLMKISRKNVAFTVDVSSITEAGDWTLTGRLNYPGNVSSDSVTVSHYDDLKITVTVEPRSTRTIPVCGEFLGTEAEGYQTGTITVSPDTLTLTGPEDTLEKITCALAQVEETELSSSLTVQSSFVLMNAEGIPADVANVTTDVSAVTVTVPVRKVAQVPLTVELIDGGGATAEDVTCTITPESVTLVAEREDEELPEFISLGEIDLGEVFDGASYYLPIEIPEDVEGWNAPEFASVRLTMEGLTSIQVPVETSSIQLENLPKGYEAQLVSDYLYVWVRGPVSSLLDLVREEILVTADLSDCEKDGSLQRIPVNITLEGDDRAQAGVLGGHYSIALRLVPEGSG